MGEFWCLTTYFNPCKYKALLSNYFLFAEELAKQNVNLLTIELAFGDDDFDIPQTENVKRIRSESVMWQKERLVNYGISQLPPDCKYYAWLDCDVLFPDGWDEKACQLLEKCDILQLYKKVIHLPRGTTKYEGQHVAAIQGIVWQRAVHKNWLERRINKQLSFSAPGFAWAAKRNTFEGIDIYDRNIVGSGDTFLVDCYFDSWAIHGYAAKFNEAMKEDMMAWRDEFNKRDLMIDYLPVDIWHLWHGNLKNRKYMDRHDIVLQNNYDPRTDIKLVNNVFEWATDKPEFHEQIRQYFLDRKEDEE